MELLSKLGIDWSLLLAQAVNFFLILGILTYLVYRPVLRLLDERSVRVRRAMEDAEKIENQKRDMDRLRAKELAQVDAEAGEILSKARQQAEGKREDILAQAQREAADLLEKGRAVIDAERRKAYDDVRADIGKLVIRLTEKILERNFTPEDQRRLVQSLENEIPNRLS